MTATTAHDADSGAAPPPWGRLRDWLIASDPALTRLRLASRAMLSVLLAIAVLAGFGLYLHPLPLAAYGLAVVMAFLGSMAVLDPTPRQQVETRLYALGVASAAVLLASLLAPVPIVADIAFLVVIFFSVYVRSAGQRWLALGMVAVMAYFMGDYMRPQPADIGWLAFAAAVTLAVTHVVTNWILASTPERDFRRALGTIDRRLNLILRTLRGAAEPRGAAMTSKPLLKHLSQLREIVLMAEGFIPQGEEGSLAARGAASDLAVALFDLQLVVERLVAVGAATPPPAPLLNLAISNDIAKLRQLVPDDEGAMETGHAARLLHRTIRARARLDVVLGAAPSPAFARITKPPAIAAPKPLSVPGAKKPLVPVAWQLPIQVTLACAIAMAVGLLLSPVRWYWALLTAFIVFNNARSRADTAQRAWQRTLGTVAGLFGGTLIATLLSGQAIASIVAIPVLFFVGFYFLQVSYGLMIFFITVALALIYGVMGSFTPGLLVLRLEETIVGSLAGTAVAFLVFPTRASFNAGAALEKYLQMLADLVAAARSRAHGEPEPLHLLAHSRLLDRSYTDLANAVRPLGGPWGAVTRFGGVRERLLLLTACAHWGRVLARSLKPGEPPLPAMLERIDALASEVEGRITAVRSVKDTFFERSARSDPLPAALPPSLPVGGEEATALALALISALLARALPTR